MKEIPKIKKELDDFNKDMPEIENPPMMPIIATDQDKEDLYKDGDSLTLPILTLRNTVLFPGVVIPITVGRDKSTLLVKHVNEGDKMLGVVAQRNSDSHDPEYDELYDVGTLGRILKLISLPDGKKTIIIQGQQKLVVDKYVDKEPYFKADVHMLEDTFPSTDLHEIQVLVTAIRDAASKILKLNPDLPEEAQVAIDNIDDPTFLTHFLASNLNVNADKKQEMLEIVDGEARAKKLLGHLLQEVKMLEIRNEIHHKVNSDIDQQQRDYFLRQQMKVLQDELGGGAEEEVGRLRLKGEQKDWPEKAKRHFFKELDKLSRINPNSAEYPVHINYCEFMVALPWNEKTKDSFNLKRAQAVLDRDHYGLTNVKERMIEYLAVSKLKQSLKGPIICLHGPPGVGKTSLGRSIAEALGRKYIRMSLGGLRDEAELRGHRKTYIGAMAGRILQSLKKAGSSNPVFILDEIDKVASEFRGDPSSALLEILDPEQNSEFTDNFLEVEYDLSNILFIATANSLSTIQPALRDRMEMIEVTGYTLEEKVEIAKKHLVPKHRKEHGLMAKHVTITEQALRFLIDGYTRESGVRDLGRKIASIIRNVAKFVAMEEEYVKTISPKRVEEILGIPRFSKELYQGNEDAGVATGLAWTSVGGEILFIESSLSKGKGKLTISGQLGDVMKESASAALSYLRAHAAELEINHQLFEQYDLHIHVPAGAVPKDGPSAGITMLTSIASSYTQRKVKAELAMTGEITLTGNVLPVGGIKEKLLAARRAGIKDIVMSERNKRDVSEIDEKYLDGLNVTFVEKASEVLKIALLKEKVDHPIILEVKK